MFFILSKILLFLLSPFTWALFAFFIAYKTKNVLRRKKSLWIGVGILLFFSNSFIFNEFSRLWEVHGTPISEVKNYDVAIVLGGMSEYNHDLNALSVRKNVDRIWQAISLYKLGKVKKILISGDHGYLIDKGLHEAKQFKKTLCLWGFPSEDILTESISKNTYENAVESKKVLLKNGYKNKRILLITSSVHMRRARACFEKQGIKFDCFSTDLHTGPKRYYSIEDFIIPEVSNITNWHSLMKESVGYFSYWISGKL